MASKQHKNDDLLTPDQAAEMLGLSVRMVRQYCQEQRIPARRYGWQWLIPREDLEEFARIPRKPGPPSKHEKKSG